MASSFGVGGARFSILWSTASGGIDAGKRSEAGVVTIDRGSSGGLLAGEGKVGDRGLR